MSKFTRVLGIDPGSRATGFGLIRTDGRTIEVLSCGVISPPSDASFHERIGVIAEEFEILIRRLAPDVTVVERIFLGKNADSAFKLGHARGVILAGAVRSGCRLFEYSARKVKKGITGSGAASKDQVQMILGTTLGLKLNVQADASDALALAVYHARLIEVEVGLLRQLAREKEANR